LQLTPYVVRAGYWGAMWLEERIRMLDAANNGLGDLQTQGLEHGFKDLKGQFRKSNKKRCVPYPFLGLLLKRCLGVVSASLRTT